MKIGVLDYGAGNLKNVCRAITHLNFDYQLVSNEKDVLSVDKLVIPGVGAYKVAMEQLNEKKLIEPIKKIANQGVPILGICLGMQLLFEESFEFGITQGLCLLNGKVDKIPTKGISGKKLKVPHIGWNELILNNSESSIIKGIQNSEPFYFVHSFRVVDFDESVLVGHCLYDGLQLPGIVKRDNIYGCQFHPEKSGINGLKVLKNFLGDYE